MFIKNEIKRLKKEKITLNSKLFKVQNQIDEIQNDCKHDWEQTGSCGYDRYFTCKICEKEMTH